MALFLFELHVCTRATTPTILSTILNPFLQTFTSRPPYLPFQALSLARKMVLTFFIALSQLGPLLSSPSSAGAVDGQGNSVAQQQLDRLDANIRLAEAEASRLMALEVTPFVTATGDAGGGDGQTDGGAGMGELRNSMRRWLVDNTVRSNGEVRSAIGRVIERRRAGAPAGAR